MTDAPTTADDIDIIATDTGDGWAAGFHITIDGVEHGWVLGIYDTETQALDQAHQAVYSAMLRTYPPEVGDP